jgi:hypothetical protein
VGLKADGSIVAWGFNVLGQCDVPPPNADFVALAAGGYHSLGLQVGGCDPCDVNCDGVVDAFDIEPFFAVLVNPSVAPCAACAGDANGDGVIDAFDIEPFIDCLIGP